MARVIIDVDVHDPQQMLQAATAQALKEGAAKNQTEAHDMLCPGGDIDTTACLIMLLDPGSLPGVDINETYVD